MDIKRGRPFDGSILLPIQIYSFQIGGYDGIFSNGNAAIQVVEEILDQMKTCGALLHPGFNIFLIWLGDASNAIWKT